jgi:nodulation protein Z
MRKQPQIIGNTIPLHGRKKKQIKQYVNIFLRAYIYISIGTSLPLHGGDVYKLTERFGAGFFSVFNTVIGALDFVEKNGAGMKIDFGTKGLYYDIFKGPNWWEYYFEPINFGSHGALIKKFSAYQKGSLFSVTAQFKMPKKRAHELIQKYVKIKSCVQEKIDAFVARNFKDHYVIGVHYRGTDKWAEAPKVSYEEVYNMMVSSIKRQQQLPIKIFIATDDALFLAYIEQQFPHLVCALDAIRSTDGKSVHIHEKMANYKKGEDALIDCILLSKCDLLIKTASNLSDVSTQFNPNIPVIHLNKSYYE